ncbi:hypothetical protein AB9P05_12560 [Roseivirga sp. BDSF3-8]|uniref:hypothetical protein n=1 Tax=Roseivirga sp. BDSF3-8 TaxID=3241598 RepID=UPI003531F0A6
MDTFSSILLTLHIAGGTIALVAGCGAIITTKNVRIHRRFGRWYFYGMTLVFLSAVVLAFLRELSFLFMIAFFSYFLVITGYRSLRHKRIPHTHPDKWLDELIAVIALVFNISLIGWGAYQYYNGASFGIVAIVFGLVGLSVLYSFSKKLRPGTLDKKHWLYSHISGMGGGYISTWTAFLVVNVDWLPSIVIWLLPTIIGTPLISYAIRRQKLKSARRQKNTG